MEVIMNDTIRQLNERKSVRAFLDREITSEQKQAILNAACQAPTAGNQQLYTIIDITDQSIKERLVETCDNQPFIASAKMVLIFCADCKKWYDAFCLTGCEPRLPAVGDLMLAVSDANIAAQNAVTAAESLGIGSCYIGDIMENYEEQRALLNIPEYVFPAAMLVFGYPTKQQLEREKPRRADMEHIVHENAYREMDKDELYKLFSIRADKKTYEDYMRAFCTRKYNSEFSVEMSRSVGEYIKQFKS
jgi:nitroreductase/FMN reductase (NADPH)/FMN reductase [NAD(P)H]